MISKELKTRLKRVIIDNDFYLVFVAIGFVIGVCAHLLLGVF